jgi:DNA-binding MarR family transcriptional regulator
MTKASLSQADYRNLADFRHLLRQFLAFSENAARDAGLAPQQHQAMLAIKGAGGCLTTGALAERLAIKPHSAVGLIDRLAEAGFITRNINPDDRRQVELRLTAGADKKLAALSQSHREELKRLKPLFAPLLDELSRG